MAIHTCRICKKKFYTPTSWKYCSDKCYRIHYTEQRKKDYITYVRPRLNSFVTIEKVRYDKEEIKRLVLPTYQRKITTKK